jgi:hypothetical protein
VRAGSSRVSEAQRSGPSFALRMLLSSGPIQRVGTLVEGAEVPNI